MQSFRLRVQRYEEIFIQQNFSGFFFQVAAFFLYFPFQDT